MVIDIEAQNERDKNDPNLYWCEKHDIFYNTPDSEVGKIGGITSCWSCDNERREENEKKQAFNRRVNSLLRAIDVGMFFGMCFDDYIAISKEQLFALDKAKKIVEKYDSFEDKGTQVLFYGKSGTGKTMLESIIAQEICKLGHKVLLTTVQRMIRSIRETFNAKTSEQEKIDEFSSCDFLMLDEVGVSLQSDYEKTVLFEILDERYKHKRPTLMTTNLSAIEVEQYLGFRLMRRFRDSNGLIIPFEWDEYKGNRDR